MNNTRFTSVLHSDYRNMSDYGYRDNVRLMSPTYTSPSYASPRYILIEEKGENFELSFHVPEFLRNSEYNTLLEQRGNSLLTQSLDQKLSTTDLKSLKDETSLKNPSGQILIFETHVTIIVKSTDTLYHIIKELNRIILNLDVRFHTAKVDWIPLRTPVQSIKDVCPGLFLDLNRMTFVLDFGNLKLKEANEMQKKCKYKDALNFYQECRRRYPWKVILLNSIAESCMELHLAKDVIINIDTLLGNHHNLPTSSKVKAINLKRRAYLELGIYNLLKVKDNPKCMHLNNEFTNQKWQTNLSAYEKELGPLGIKVSSEDSDLDSIEDINLKAGLKCLRQFMRLGTISGNRKFFEDIEEIVTLIFATLELSIPMCIVCRGEIPKQSQKICGALRQPRTIEKLPSNNFLLYDLLCIYNNISRFVGSSDDQLPISLSTCKKRDCELKLRSMFITQLKTSGELLKPQQV